MTWDGMLPQQDCQRCGKPLNTDGGHPAELYAGTFTGLCYKCEREGPYVVKTYSADGAQRISYPPSCPSWRRDRVEHIAYPDCPQCKGTGRIYVDRPWRTGGGYHKSCDRLSACVPVCVRLTASLSACVPAQAGVLAQAGTRTGRPAQAGCLERFSGHPGRMWAGARSTALYNSAMALWNGQLRAVGLHGRLLVVRSTGEEPPEEVADLVEDLRQGTIARLRALQDRLGAVAARRGYW